MSVTYQVNAIVIDIQRDQPLQDESFLVDTNVWYWMTYSKASVGLKPYQSNYLKYIGYCLSNKSILYRCNLSLSEIIHIIERNEKDIYNTTNKSTLNTKEFRHNLLAERSQTLLEISSSWSQIKTMARPLPAVSIDDESTDEALNDMSIYKVDGYDALTVRALQSSTSISVLSDDGDFSTVPNIKLFTANANVIKAAKSQGKLLAR